MVQDASLIDITPPPRFSSNSPQTQTSNLTSALREAGASQDHSRAPVNPFQNTNNLEVRDTRPSLGGHRESVSSVLGSSFYGNGARPISMKDRPRRDSNNMGSFAGGMSWGGMSVGSWIRDDIMMTGTSPAAFNQSPSFHSSSYLPKMEANFMKDFTCCGLTLASLHDLLQHFEEVHANAPASRTSQSAQGGLAPAMPTTGDAVSSANAAVDSTTHPQLGFQTRTGSVGASRSQRLGSEVYNRTSLSTVQDMDTLEDMEMDDVDSGLSAVQENPTSPFTASQFPINEQPLQPLNVNLANNMQTHQGLRTPTAGTPTTAQPFSLQHNPTVSSVNTPTLGTLAMQNTTNLASPESSHPSTPAELDMEFANFNSALVGMQSLDMNFANAGMAGRLVQDGTIDQPGKRLFSKQGGAVNHQALQAAFKNYQLGNGDQSTFPKGMQQPHVFNNSNSNNNNNNNGNVPFPFPEELKRFRCPVIGCDKAYKNQNGLKYHKQHGHQNQQLKENEDGTFSIVDPVTSIPYPGTVGMEKEKPYRCQVCGKRYKNLNGLKYHRTHAPRCNPELGLSQFGAMPALQGLTAGANVAGAGMSGMDNSMF